MDHVQITTRVQELLAKILDLPPASIGPGFSAQSTLAWTSLNHLMLISQLENEFGVFFSNQEIRDLDSVEKIVTTVARRRDIGA
jgi:acyl carrier protein